MQKALAMWILLAAGGGGQPEVSPTQVVQTATEQVLQVVQDGELAAPPAQERHRLEVQRIADRLFDFPEMARRALAVHWRDRTPQEQNEFPDRPRLILPFDHRSYGRLRELIDFVNQL